VEAGPNAAVVGVVDTAAGCIEVDFEQESYDYSDDVVVVVVAGAVVVAAVVVVAGSVGLELIPS